MFCPNFFSILLNTWIQDVGHRLTLKRLHDDSFHLTIKMLYLITHPSYFQHFSLETKSNEHRGFLDNLLEDQPHKHFLFCHQTLFRIYFLGLFFLILPYPAILSGWVHVGSKSWPITTTRCWSSILFIFMSALNGYPFCDFLGDSIVGRFFRIAPPFAL